MLTTNTDQIKLSISTKLQSFSSTRLLNRLALPFLSSTKCKKCLSKIQKTKISNLSQNRIQQSKMDDLSSFQLKQAVKLQFSRRCEHFQPILAHMGQDFITRYSTKLHPHPQFFKQDTWMLHQQLTLHSDQCISAMRKFAFMERPATILSALITSLLKVNEYLAKQLYHHLKALNTQQISLANDPICPSCLKMRENQRIRVLRDELSLNDSSIFANKVVRQAMSRKGQKYNVEQLLQEQLQGLEQLNEEQVRKRLGKLQIDHDKRRQEMSVCIQELSRANERVLGYSKVVEKKTKYQSNFNIKEYVFQISRHFYHNISSLDHKIKGLKQVINPLNESSTQTQQEYVLLSLHQQAVNHDKIQIIRLKSTVHDLQSQLLLEQTKTKEQLDNCGILQEKLRQIESQIEQSKLNEKVLQSQLKGNLAQYQSKTENLEKIVKKLKTTNKLKEVELIELYEAQGNRPVTSKVENPSRIKIEADLNEVIETTERQHKKQLKANLTVKSPSFLSSNLNSRLVQKINIIKVQKQKAGKLSFINELTQTIHKIYSEMHQQTRNRLKIQQIFEQTINFKFLKEEPNNTQQTKERVSLYNIQLKNLRSNCQEKGSFSKNSLINSQNQTLSRFNKKGRKKIDIKSTQAQKISAIKAKENLVFVQSEKVNCLKSVQNEGKEFSVFDPQRTKIQFKKNIDSLKSKAGYYAQKSQKSSKQSNKLFRRDFGGIQSYKKNAKKRRHLSQQNSFDENDQLENVRRSIDKLITKECNAFTDQDTKALFQLKSSQLQLKSTKKGTLYKPDNHKTVLSLQQINYSTYFYSLIAKLHLKNPVAYINLKKMLSVIPGQGNEEDGVKNSLNALIANHRKCKSTGSICSHLQHFIEKVKNL